MTTSIGSEVGGCDCAKSGGAFPQCPEWWRLRRGEGGLPAAREHWQAAYGNAVQKARDEAAGDDWVTRLQRMGVPSTALVALRNPQATPCMDAARKYLASERGMFPLLAMIGKPGLGKTVAAGFVLADFARKWDWNGGATGETAPPAMFVPAARMTRLSSFDDADQTLFAHAQRAQLVVVDDIGDEATDFAKGHVVDLLKARIDANRRTVITSNLAPKAFKERYGDALADRIAGRSIRPILDGQSMRRRLEVAR